MPKYLQHLNKHGIPTYAMWTDLAFNALLLFMSNYLFVLAVFSVNYVLFHYLNLNAGWNYRIDNPRVSAPTGRLHPLPHWFLPGILQRLLDWRRSQRLGPGHFVARFSLGLYLRSHILVSALHRRQRPVPKGHAKRSVSRR